jgi:beta-1,4-mannosyl-glycoprotein beta-1,4-N-acetylglucosaminyltransferase
MIYDCFLFFDELELLDIRLNYLDPIIDRFVIVESTKTFSLRDKPLVFQQNREKFSKFLRKIEYVIVDDFSSPNTWDNERYQRDCIIRGLKGAQSDDIILLSDCDEIPRIESFRFSSLNGIVGFNQRIYYYYLNGLLNIPWVGTKAFSLETLRRESASKIRDTFLTSTFIDAGWHFSFLGTPERIARKIRAFSHQELNKPEFTDLEKIKQRMQKLEDVFSRSHISMSYVTIDSSYPDYILKNLERFKHLIYGGSV